MSKAFVFNTTLTCDKHHKEIEVLCISYGECVYSQDLEFIFSDIEDALKSLSIMPDVIAIIASKKMQAGCVNVWAQYKLRREEIIDRGKRLGIQFIKGFYFYSWGGTNGTPVLEHLELTAGIDFEIPTAKLLSKGLISLVKKNNVAQIAPAGHVFKHPSNTKSKLFIQTRDLANDQPELKFVAEAIAMKGAQEFSKADVVFIDTMGVYAFVHEALTTCKSHARIQSFHGYDGLKNLEVPDENYFVVISASTSGGMEAKLVQKKFKKENILTLIDTSVKREGSVLISLEDVSQRYKKALKDGGETEIELVGENFSSKSKPPRSVTLITKHTPKVLGEILDHFAIGGVNELNTSICAGQKKLLSLDVGNSLPKNTIFQAWLYNEIDWAMPVAIDTILYSDDDVSKRIAKLINQHIFNEGHRSQLKLIPYIESSLGALINSKGILVVSAVCGDGTLLRQMSRDLREYTKGTIPRHFLIPLALPQAASAWSRLKQFLSKNSTKLDYAISNWLCLPIGHEGYNAWEKYNLLANEMEMPTSKPSDIDSGTVSASLDAAALQIRSSDKGFMPKYDGTKLELTEGFVYFDGKFDKQINTKKIIDSVVYLTISSVIQHAREIDDINHQLKPTGYESVVISPETFLRFNDSILQACILRAALPSELDYSSSADLSKLMKELLTKVFDRAELKFGEAAMEYALAIASGKLKLKDNDLKELIASSINKIKNKQSALLGVLIYIDNEIIIGK